MLGPKTPGSSICWCLSHRVDSKINREMVGPARGEHVRQLCGRGVAPGVLAYEAGERAGFTMAAATDAVSGGFPCVVMRLTLG